MKLVIANKNYSSWSLRAWLLLRHAGIDFDEERLSFLDPQFKEKLLAYSPAGRVPVLIDGALTVWDSLAIAEYIAEKFPERELWPRPTAARAQARSICCEMHAGFAALRARMPMNVSARLPGRGLDADVAREIDRISMIWIGLRNRHAESGPFLFGRFSVVDAYFAPVVWRFNTYEPPLAQTVRDYVQMMIALPAMREWSAAAGVENEFVKDDEPYRDAPG